MSMWESNDLAAAQEANQRRIRDAAKAREDKTAAERQAEQDRASREAEHLPVAKKLLGELQAAEKARADEAPAYNAAVRKYRALDAAREAKYRELAEYVSEHFGDPVFGSDGKVLSETYHGLWLPLVVEGQKVERSGATTPTDHPEKRPFGRN